MNSDTPELITTNQEKWLVRETITRSYNKKKEMNQDTIKVELVYGHYETFTGKNDVTMTIVVGPSFHELTGPTADKSICEMAENLNKRGFIPDGKLLPKTVADGFVTKFKDRGGDSLFDAATLQKTISYAPKR